MLQLRPEHLEALRESASRPVRRRVGEALRLYFPDLVRSHSEEELDRQCLQAWDLADEHQLEDSGDVYVLAVAMLLYGPTFNGAPWLLPVLKDRTKSSRERIAYIAFYMTIEQEKKSA